MEHQITADSHRQVKEKNRLAVRLSMPGPPVDSVFALWTGDNGVART